MSASGATLVLGYGGALLFVLGTVVAGLGVLADPRSALRRRAEDYADALERMQSFLMATRTGRDVLRGQGLAAVAVLAASLLLQEWLLLLLLPAVAAGPYVVLRRRCRRRIERLEEQLDPWLLMLSNALKASPSLGDAMGNTARLTRPPMGEELDLALKQMKLGTPLDQAVLNMSTRVGSPAIGSALATILVGRQTGGDLPRILEESAATLREMARLEGVVRTKTAEGKTQAYVLAVIPFALIGAIHLVDENWLRPLGETATGFLVIGVAALLWVSAIFLARRILAVDV